MNESSGKSSGSAEQRKYCCVTGALPAALLLLVFCGGVGGNERERGVGLGAGADWIDHSIQMIAHGGFKRVFFRSFADRS